LHKQFNLLKLKSGPENTKLGPEKRGQKRNKGRENLTNEEMKNDRGSGIVVIDKELQNRYPTILISSTTMFRVSNGRRAAIQELRTSEPKLVHDK